MRGAWRFSRCGLLLLLALPAWPQAPSPGAGVAVAPAAGAAAAAPFDPVAASDAYLARFSPVERARSDAYFEGGYWLQLWGLLYGLAVAWLLLATGLSARLRDQAERATRWRPLQTFLYALQYILATVVLLFPLSVYEDFFRERRYGLSTQTFGAWLGDQGKGLGLALVFGGLALVALYAVLRRAPRTWWLWGAALVLLLLAAGDMVAPVFIAPLFNRYTRLADPALRGPILSLARANGIPADDVDVEDASRQTTRVSAHVSGMFDTLRITLNDNLLRRGSRAAVMAVMGHEMGHYVLNHTYEMIPFAALVLLAGFAFVYWGFDRARLRWGERWGVRGVADPAGLPLLVALFLLYGFVLTPLVNTFIRTNEAEADIFGLNAAREPDGAAEAALLLGQYRKLAPGPLEEWIFFDHPSGRTRILRAMRWKAEHLGESGAAAAPQPAP
jgi:Zn-dependent protease with chaperone function